MRRWANCSVGCDYGAFMTEPLIAVMADHGEALGDHGETTARDFSYDETIRVPLLFKLPRERSAGNRIDSRAGLVDVLPTILQGVGIAIPHDVQGESLLSMLKPTTLKPTTQKPAASEAGTAIGKTLESSPWIARPYAESDYPHRTFG